MLGILAPEALQRRHHILKEPFDLMFAFITHAQSIGHGVKSGNGLLIGTVRRIGIALPRNCGVLHRWNSDKSRNIFGRIVFFLHFFEIKCHKSTS